MAGVTDTGSLDDDDDDDEDDDVGLTSSFMLGAGLLMVVGRCLFICSCSSDNRCTCTPIADICRIIVCINAYMSVMDGCGVGEDDEVSDGSEPGEDEGVEEMVEIVTDGEESTVVGREDDGGWSG